MTSLSMADCHPREHHPEHYLSGGLPYLSYAMRFIYSIHNNDVVLSTVFTSAYILIIVYSYIERIPDQNTL